MELGRFVSNILAGRVHSSSSSPSYDDVIKIIHNSNTPHSLGFSISRRDSLEGLDTMERGDLRRTLDLVEGYHSPIEEDGWVWRASHDVYSGPKSERHYISIKRATLELDRELNPEITGDRIDISYDNVVGML